MMPINEGKTARNIKYGNCPKCTKRLMRNWGQLRRHVEYCDGRYRE